MGRSITDDLWRRRPFASRLLVATWTRARRTKPSLLGRVSMTFAILHWFLDISSSRINTISPCWRFQVGCNHFCLFDILAIYSFFHLAQNCWSRYWTLLQRFFKYRSCTWKGPGGGEGLLDFIVRTWFGMSGTGDRGSLWNMVVRGRELTMDMAS